MRTGVRRQAVKDVSEDARNRLFRERAGDLLAERVLVANSQAIERWPWRNSRPHARAPSSKKSAAISNDNWLE
eukprot:9954040-Alexandrium_andersonii.AAC.1